MKRNGAVIGTAMFLAIALWTFLPDNSFAQRASRTSVKAAAHASGIVVGRPVHSERGVVLGTVENVVLNDSGCAQFVVISGRFPGARSMWYPIPWNVISRSTPEAIFVNIEPDVLVKAPSFSRKKLPDLLHSDFNTRVNTFFQTRAKEEKGKTEGRVKEKGRDQGTRPTQGTVSPEEKVKGKARMEKERQLKPSEMSGEGTSKPKELDAKPKQHMEGDKGAVKPGTSEMKKQEQPEKMERGSSQMERGRPETTEQGKPGKGGPGHEGPTVEPGQKGEKVK
jgi:PRC-barrel domain